MAAIIALLRQIGVIIAGYMSAQGINNAVGWLVSGTVSISFIALWISVLNALFGYLLDNVTGPLEIFGSFPAGGIWLLSQAIPVQLFLTMSVTYIVVRFAAGHLVMIAVGASRLLKG